ncbi:EAL domain-containing protein [Candidatus Kuenenia sp.]|uniref:EAL domain-containing protein n=1 Tax=Candidatus Kuenenia sp. TaxID=2499824 RepID=UPI0032202A64
MNPQPIYQNLTAGNDFHDIHILIVDDDPGMLESVKQLLEIHKYCVTTIKGGSQACQALSVTSYDLLLLDLNLNLNLNGISGYDVMNFMNDHSIKTPVIVISGNTSFASVSKAIQTGALDYIKKPYDPEELLVKIKNTTTKIQREELNIKMQRHLKKSEVLHRYIVNNSPDIICTIDHERRIMFINTKIENLLGYKPQELIGKLYSELVCPEDVEKLNVFVKEKIARSSGNCPPDKIEICLVPKGNYFKRRYFELTLFPVELNLLGFQPKNRNISGEKLFGVYAIAHDITERKEAKEYIHFQACHDLLTKLPNRASFEERGRLAVNKARQNNGIIAVLFLDLDRFKTINDSLGHAMGDRLLQSVTQRLESCLRKYDTLSRFGADEFMLLLPEINAPENAGQVALKITDIMHTPFVIGGQEIFGGVSIGISVFPEHGETIEQLIQNAEIAMYQAKGRGKKGVQFFDKGMNTSSPHRLAMERDLRWALKNNEFEIVYQPQITISTGKVIGFEALVRWNHPEKGKIRPCEFIPIAEETKLIEDLGEWIIHQACCEVREWIKKGHDTFRLSINISPLQIENPHFVENFVHMLGICQFPGKNMEIELTESILMADLEHIAQILNHLHKHSITVAIDDFGIGYSSLSYIQKLPIHTLKIDQSFMQSIQNETDESCLVNAIIAMGKGLHLCTVAEGVETMTQIKYLQNQGCDAVQGYYFGEPQLGEKCLRLLEETTFITST